MNEHRRIFRQIYRIVGNVHDAEDLTQETFIKALVRQDQLNDNVKAAHWLSKIATNTAIDFLRRQARVNFCEIADAHQSHVETPEAAVAPNSVLGWQPDWSNSLPVSARRWYAVTWNICRSMKWHGDSIAPKLRCVRISLMRELSSKNSRRNEASSLRHSARPLVHLGAGKSDAKAE